MLFYNQDSQNKSWTRPMLHFSSQRLFILILFGFATGCASTSTSTSSKDQSYEALAASCGPGNHADCFAAGDMVFNTRPSALQSCSGDQRLCVQEAESQTGAMERLKAEAIELNKIACSEGDNAEACVRVGMALAQKASKLPLDNYRHVADEAESYFEKGCGLGLVKGCVFRGSSYRAGG